MASLLVLLAAAPGPAVATEPANARPAWDDDDDGPSSGREAQPQPRFEGPLDPRDRVPLAPPPPRGERWEDDDDDGPIDWEGMHRRLAERFPGIDRIDFLRVLVSKEARVGVCQTVVSPPWQTRVDVRYAIGPLRAQASGFEALKQQGWWPIYRAPEGTGVELREPLTEVDLTYAATVACRCAGEGNAGDTQHLVLRFRWARGEMPEVSASVTQDDVRKGLAPSIVYGHLLTYEFGAQGAFPEGRRGACGAELTLSILADPPIL